MKNKNIFGLVFDTANGLLLVFAVFMTLYPFWHIICASFSSTPNLNMHTGLLLHPLNFTLGAYKLTFEHPLVLSGFRNIFIILAAALPLNIIMTLLCGYFLASRGVLFKRHITAVILFTMFFSGGLIPTYLNIRALGLYNTLWALIIPGAMSVYNSIIVKTAIEGVPDSLRESAYIDGANDFYVLFMIIARLIIPTLAVMVLYYGVGHWNSWFPATIYITENKLLPLQAVLRALLIENNSVLNASMMADDTFNEYAETIKYAIIMVATLPILASYPFLQGYFVKGVMIGAIKG